MMSISFAIAQMKLAAFSASLLLLMNTVLANDSAPKYFRASPGAMAAARQRLASGDKQLARALKKLVEEADAELKQKPVSVTEKTKAPPSGDMHDYMSMAPYFWPDPKSKTGLPYERHDGKVNPESKEEHSSDANRISRMGNAIETLSLAYYFTGNEAYAAQAANFAKAWFLDPATKMNPNLQFAQAVPGKNTGRGTGILEGRHIAIAADALRLLAGSPSWTASDDKALQAWLNAYLDWLLNSEPGKEERAARNNHGTWFDVQACELALCTGRAEIARQIVEAAKLRRVSVQVQRDGRQPLELERTKSFGYSCFNLEALCELATLGQYAGSDLWHYTTSDGRSIRRALDFMLPYLDTPAKKWPYEQIKATTDSEYLLTLRKAALAFSNPAYEKVLQKYPDSGTKRFQLLFVD